MTALTTLCTTLALLAVSESAARVPPPACGLGPQFLYPLPPVRELPRNGWIVVASDDAASCVLATTGTTAVVPGRFGSKYATLRPDPEWTPGDVLNVQSGFGLGISSDFLVRPELATELTAAPTLSELVAQYHPDQEAEETRWYEIRGTIDLPEHETTSIVQVRFEPPGPEINDDSATLVAVAALADQVTFEHDAWLALAGRELCVVLHVRDQAGGFGPPQSGCVEIESSTDVMLPDAAEDGGCRAVSGPDASLLLLTAVFLLGLRRRRRAPFASPNRNRRHRATAVS